MTKKKPAGKAAPKKAAGKQAAKVEWTRNRTGKQPVADGVWVEVRLRSGEIERSPAEEFRWNRVGLGSVGDDQDIMAWRRVRKPRADKGAKLGRTLADLAASKHPRLEATGDGKVHLDLGVGTVRMPVTADVRAGELVTASGEPVRHFDRSDEPTPAEYHGEPVAFELTALHPLADQLDPTTPARPVWDEHRDGDSDGLGCARAAVWSLVGIFAVALAFVGIRALMGG